MQICQREKEVITFIGPPGAGKGTIAREWQDAHGYATLSTGELCRYHIAQKTEIGTAFDRYISAGHLVPDELINDMVAQWLQDTAKTHDGIIVDGYPRTASQVESFAQMVGDLLPDYALRVVVFEISNDTIISRLTSRIVCSNKSCQRVYNRKMIGSDIVECAQCGAPLVTRSDDNADVISERLRVYEKNRHEIVSAFEQKNVSLCYFDVDQLTLSEMFSQFNQVLALSHKSTV